MKLFTDAQSVAAIERRHRISEEQAFAELNNHKLGYFCLEKF